MQTYYTGLQEQNPNSTGFSIIRPNILKAYYTGLQEQNPNLTGFWTIWPNILKVWYLNIFPAFTHILISIMYHNFSLVFKQLSFLISRYLQYTIISTRFMYVFLYFMYLVIIISCQCLWYFEFPYILISTMYHNLYLVFEFFHISINYNVL